MDAIKFAKVGSEPSIKQQPLVLIVDDNEDNLVLLSFVVEPLNCQIITAENGQTTLELAQSCQPTLILLDMMLPDLSGIEVVAHLRQNPLTKSIPVIAVTAMAREQDRDRFLLAGCNAYVSKPFSVDELEQLLIYYLNQDLPLN